MNIVIEHLCGILNIITVIGYMLLVIFIRVAPAASGWKEVILLYMFPIFSHGKPGVYGATLLKMVTHGVLRMGTIHIGVFYTIYKC